MKRTFDYEAVLRAALAGDEEELTVLLGSMTDDELSTLENAVDTLRISIGNEFTEAR